LTDAEGLWTSLYTAAFTPAIAEAFSIAYSVWYGCGSLTAVSSAFMAENVLNGTDIVAATGVSKLRIRSNKRDEKKLY
jgi:hypothetical protein